MKAFIKPILWGLGVIIIMVVSLFLIQNPTVSTKSISIDDEQQQRNEMSEHEVLKRKNN
mgnify:FL=1